MSSTAQYRKVSKPDSIDLALDIKAHFNLDGDSNPHRWITLTQEDIPWLTSIEDRHYSSCRTDALLLTRIIIREGKVEVRLQP